MGRTEKIDLLSLINNAGKILIIGHLRPDGDCLGAGFAVKRVCEKLGRLADFVADSPFPARYGFISDKESFNVRRFSKYDLVLCVDCADLLRTGKFADFINKSHSVCIDHHETNTGYAKENYIIPSASSTCEIIYDLLKDTGLLDKETAFLLFMGLSTDTGHFMHSNTNAQTLRVASELAAYGLNVNELGMLLYRQNSIGRTKLIARAINSMRFFHNDEICVIILTQKDFEDCGCEQSETEGLTDLGMNMGNVKFTVCMSEHKQNLYKVSYRAKSGNVAESASVFGGGGHKLAAGCMISGRLEDVVVKAVKSITDGLSD